MQNVGTNISMPALVHHSDWVTLPVLWGWWLGFGVLISSYDLGYVIKDVTTFPHISPTIASS